MRRTKLKNNPPCSDSKTKIPRKKQNIKTKDKIKAVNVENLLKLQCKHNEYFGLLFISTCCREFH